MLPASTWSPDTNACSQARVPWCGNQQSRLAWQRMTAGGRGACLEQTLSGSSAGWKQCLQHGDRCEPLHPPGCPKRPVSGSGRY